MKKYTAFCAIAALATLSSSDLMAREMYRYVNDEGNVVVGYQVPTTDVKKGYEVLNEDGIVIKIVLSEAQQKARVQQDKIDAEAAAETERLRAWDESLLQRYSTIEDIEAARARAQSALLINVSILKSNTRSLKQQVENYQAQAADIERSGDKVDAERLTAIEDLQKEIRANERSIKERDKKMEQVTADFQMDIDRFEQLLDVVAWRRTMTARDNE